MNYDVDIKNGQRKIVLQSEFGKYNKNINDLIEFY